MVFVDALDIIPSKVLYLYRARGPLFFTPHHMRKDPIKIAPRYSGRSLYNVVFFGPEPEIQVMSLASYPATI